MTATSESPQWGGAKHGMTAEMIERHYATVLDGSGASVATRPARFEAEQNRDAAHPITEAP